MSNIFVLSLALSQNPVSFEVGIPPECHIVDNPSSRSYNQGQCSREHCHTLAGLCSYSNHCCYEAANTSVIRLQCANSTQLLERHVIHECGCKLCSNQLVVVEGRVVTSPNNKPVVLAAFMLDSEVLGMSDEEGKFHFVVSSMQDTTTITIIEPQHKPTTFTLHMDTLSSSYELLVVLEKISGEELVNDIMAGFQLQLEDSKSAANEAGVFSSKASLTIPAKALMSTNGVIYTGSGKVLHSIYKPSEPPAFQSAAIQDMTYKIGSDQYAIKALVLGSVSIVDDTGRLLHVKEGSEIKIEVHFQFDTTATLEEVNKIHLFSYSQSTWTDHGAVLVEDKGSLHRGRRLYSIEGKMNGIGGFWAMGLSQPLGCYVKARIFHENSTDELEGIRITLEQASEEFGHKTFYRYVDRSRKGQGVCLKSSCTEGGTIIAMKDNGEWGYPNTPSIRHGIVMDNRPELLTYYITEQSISSHGNTPYYRSEEACLAETQNSSYFKFTMATHSFPTRPLVMTANQPHNTQQPFCFVKVAVDDCLLYTDIFSLSFDKNTRQLLGSHSVVATEPDRKVRSDECYSDDVTKHRAACVQYACGHVVHISVQNRPKFAARKDCKYLSHSKNAPHNNLQPMETTSVYSFHDNGHQYSTHHLNTGLYQGDNKELTLLKCLAGDEQRPSQRISHTDGLAVTFTCQV